MKKMTLAEKRELCSADIRLCGKPARICGAKNDFGTVYTIYAPGVTPLEYEFCWPTIKRVVDNGGEFKA